MKTQPFKSSNYNDSFYKRLIKPSDKKDFWDIFSANCCPSEQFRGTLIDNFRPHLKATKPKSEVKDSHERAQIASLVERVVSDQNIISEGLKRQDEKGYWQSQKIAVRINQSFP